MDFLSSKFGLKVDEPELTEIENSILKDTDSLLNLIDKQFEFWNGKNAIKTIAALTQARECIEEFYASVINQEYGPETVVTAKASYQHMISFVKALRAPVALPEDLEGNLLRKRIIQDRQEFKNLLKSIAIQLHELLEGTVMKFPC